MIITFFRFIFQFSDVQPLADYSADPLVTSPFNLLF